MRREATSTNLHSSSDNSSDATIRLDSNQRLSSHPISSSKIEPILEHAPHIKIIIEKSLLQIQYDFHCFHCKKIWKILNLLLEHWMYDHVNDFCVLNIDRTCHGNIEVLVSYHLFSSTNNNQKFYDVLTFKELPSKNISTFAAVNLFYNFSFNEMTQDEKIHMKRWVEKTGENVNRKCAH